jgi:hypothetical protein
MTTHTTGITKVRPTDARWTTAEMEELLAGMRQPEDLRRLDQRGMTPSYAASLEAAVLVRRLMVLLDDQAEVPGQNVLEDIRALLETQVHQQAVISEKLDALITLISPRMAKLAAERAKATEEALPPPQRPRTRAKPTAPPESGGSDG